MVQRKLKSPVLELDSLANNSVQPFVRAINRLAAAVFDGFGEEGAREELQDLIAHTMTLSDLLGRRRLLMEFRASQRNLANEISPLTFAAEAERLPRVPFLEAIRDLLEREPTLAPDWRAVADLYQRFSVFSLARSTELTITRRVQKAIADMMRLGAPIRKAEEVIAQIGDWSQSYAETTYRTTLGTAYNNGRFRQAQDPEIREVIPALEVQTANDGDVRPNHFAAHGLVAAVDDPIWGEALPPYGWNCRCTARNVDRFELRRRGLLDDSGRPIRFLPPIYAAFHRDESFGARLLPA